MTPWTPPADGEHADPDVRIGDISEDGLSTLGVRSLLWLLACHRRSDDVIERPITQLAIGLADPIEEVAALERHGPRAVPGLWRKARAALGELIAAGKVVEADDQD